MGDKREVADVLSRLAFAEELLEGPTQRARAWQSASRTIWQLTGDLAAMRADGSLAGVRGIGPGTLKVIDEVLAGRTPPELAEMEAKIPAGLFDVRRIKGLGPAKVRALWNGLGITTVGELEHACHENRLLMLDGFGKKTQQNVAEAIAELRRAEGLMLRDRAEAIAKRAIAACGDTRAVVVGELACGAEVVDRVVVLAALDAAGVSAVLEALRVHEGRLEGALVELVGTRLEAFGCAEVRLTSSDAHWDALVARAAPRVLSKDGLMSGGVIEPCDSALRLYELLELAFVDTEVRTSDVLVGRGKERPRLVRREDLRGALHNHTSASDGTASLREMRDAAVRAGLSYLGISEHSKSAEYARGLTPERLMAQRTELAGLNAEGSGCTLLAGVESDILADGALDYEDAVLASLDFVVASVHRRFGLDREGATKRVVAAAKDPRTDIVGHPTGRLLLGRAPMDFDMEAMLDACRENGCAVELNGSPHRLDLSAAHLVMAKERGLLVSIAADAHATDELGYLDYAIAIARRAGLTAEDVLNTRSESELRAWLGARRARVPKPVS